MKKVHLYFWITAAIIFVLALFTYSDNQALIDINFHDTYLVVHLFYLIGLLSLLYFIFGITYWILNKLNVKLIKALTFFHAICSIGGFLVYIVVMSIFEDDTEIAETNLYNEDSTLIVILTIILFIVLLSQVTFLLNLIISIFKHVIQRRNSKPS